MSGFPSSLFNPKHKVTKTFLKFSVALYNLLLQLWSGKGSKSSSPVMMANFHLSVPALSLLLLFFFGQSPTDSVNVFAAVDMFNMVIQLCCCCLFNFLGGGHVDFLIDHGP